MRNFHHVLEHSTIRLFSLASISNPPLEQCGKGTGHVTVARYSAGVPTLASADPEGPGAADGKRSIRGLFLVYEMPGIRHQGQLAARNHPL